MRRRSVLFIVFVVLLVVFGGSVVASHSVRTALGWGSQQAHQWKIVALGAEAQTLSCDQFKERFPEVGLTDCSSLDEAKTAIQRASLTNKRLVSLRQKICLTQERNDIGAPSPTPIGVLEEKYDKVRTVYNDYDGPRPEELPDSFPSIDVLTKTCQIPS